MSSFTGFAMEIIQSLMPYWLIIIPIIAIFHLIIYLKLNFIAQKSIKIYFIGILGSSILIFLSSLTILVNFSHNSEYEFQESGETTIRLAFQNIYYDSNQFEEFSSDLSEIDPDILGFAEFTEKHQSNIDFLKEYPYKVESKKYSSRKTQNVLLSKYPIKNIERIDKDKLLPIISVDVILPKSKPIKIIITHTTSPVTPLNFQQRNQQLKELKDYLIEIRAREDEENK
jgi:hypothetical protein